MNYLITPPLTHYDGGLGITGCNFWHAAKILKEHGTSSDGVLPLCYLHRHAIELFLKSVIFILHKKYDIDFGSTFSLENPGIKVNHKWVPMGNTHNLSDLYTYFKSIFDDCKEQLPPFNWDFPSDIKTKIDLVSGTDPKSTFYRYPKSGNNQDIKKSKIQKISFNGFSAFENSRKSGILVLMLDENDNILETYDMDADALNKTKVTLDYLSEFFYGVHATFRGMLTNGS